jgi:hypothetical protein
MFVEGHIELKCRKDIGKNHPRIVHMFSACTTTCRKAHPVNFLVFSSLEDGSFIAVRYLD